MASVISVVKDQRASVNTIYHVLYGYYFLGISKSRLATIYLKHRSTITNWIKRYEEDGFYSRREYEKDAVKFSPEKRQWLVQLYQQNPTLYLHESKKRFQREFSTTISISSIWRIIHNAGLTWKCLERRAIQIKESDIVRFFYELSCIPWDYQNLIFLDEFSIDNRSMLRPRGYGVRGQRLVFRGEFVRKPRESMLCFIGQEGMLEAFSTNGTFNRLTFFDCCRRFALESDQVQCYPGRHSIWIMDGAKIHCSAKIIEYFRSIGIFPIFLPAYCPFFNPIEVVFGLCKRQSQSIYKECGQKDIKPVVAEVMATFRNYDMSNLFRKCGYMRGGRFDPSVADMSNLENFP